jgi:serine/threonine protein kinase
LDQRAKHDSNASDPTLEVESPKARDSQRSRAASSRRDRAPCLTNNEVLEFISGQASLDVLDRIDEHVDKCSACFDLIRVSAPDEGRVSDSQARGLTFRAGNLIAGRYRIQRFVDRGGMGEVYDALDLKLGERVALKTLLCSAGDSPHAVRKLFAEVQLARRISDRHVCRIYELHEHAYADADSPPVHFLTMEFIDGEKLGRLLSKGPLPLAEAATLAGQLLGGLRAAHEAGVVHLDFKSDNVMLRAGAQPPEAVVMDFGLARALDTQSRLRTSERKQLAGSVAYMAPEQVECQPVLGEAADIYAFGIVLFEMLTGRLPFEGQSPAVVMLQRLKRAPAPPSSLRPEVPKALDAFVLTCLQRDPRRRFPDAATALRELELAMTRGAPTVPGRRRAAIGSLVLASLVAAALGVKLLLPAEGSSGAGDPLRAGVATARATLKARPPPPSADPSPDPKGDSQPTEPASLAEPGAPSAGVSPPPEPQPHAARKPPRPTPIASPPKRPPQEPTVNLPEPPSDLAASEPPRSQTEARSQAEPPSQAEPRAPDPLKRIPGLPGAPPRLR